VFSVSTILRSAKALPTEPYWLTLNSNAALTFCLIEARQHCVTGYGSIQELR
jgi:hypothetical protein